MSNVTPIKIDTTDGRLPIKEKGLVFQEFANPAEERRNQLEKLAAGFRLFDYFGFNEGVAGHITYRDPEFKDHFWVNPLGVHFSQISVSDLLLVNHDGKVVQGDKDVNVAAFAIHSRLHKARPDVNAAAHSHSIYGRTFSTLGKLLDPISQDACAFYENQGIYKDFSGVVEKPEGCDKGYYVRPTVFADVTNDMTIAKEEIFGPVLCIMKYETEEEAIQIANDTEYGLAGYVQGELSHAIEVGNQIRAGQITINGGARGNAAPFGGYKASGNGREHGLHGIEECLETKAIIVPAS